MPFLKQKDPSIPPGQVETRKFPVLHVGEVPAIDPSACILTVTGLVERPLALSYDELRALPASEFHGDIHCVTRWSKKATAWRGVRFRELAVRAGIESSATHVIQHAHHGYTTNVPLSAMLDDDVLVAYEFDGAPLEAVHGGPVRLIVPKRYFWKSAKWLERLDVTDHDEPGFWETRGYHNDADPWREERYADVPLWMDRVNALAKPRPPR